MTEKTLFDDWPERYESWFATPIGSLVFEVELALVMQMLDPGAGEHILDAGCGTGKFTMDYLAAGARVTGLDLSAPMLEVAIKKAVGLPFTAVQGDMTALPFADGQFDKTVSVTALEFIADGAGAVRELLRVTRPGGVVVVGTLNSLSPWAARRTEKTTRGEQHVLEHAHYRSPMELLALSPLPGTARTVVHFQKDDPPDAAREAEKRGQEQSLNTGAFAAARWVKPPAAPGVAPPAAQREKPATNPVEGAPAMEAEEPA